VLLIGGCCVSRAISRLQVSPRREGALARAAQDDPPDLASCASESQASVSSIAKVLSIA